MFHELNEVQYLALNSMLEGTSVQRNCFYVLELDSDHLQIDRFDRINPLGGVWLLPFLVELTKEIRAREVSVDCFKMCLLV